MTIDTSKMSIADRVRLKRTAENKTQHDVARETGISRNYISFYESGRMTMSKEHKEKLLAYLEA